MMNDFLLYFMQIRCCLLIYFLLHIMVQHSCIYVFLTTENNNAEKKGATFPSYSSFLNNNIIIINMI